MTKIILPTYICTLPSTGKKIKFRPFTIKEEKALLLALEENNILVVVEAIKNTIESCTNGSVNVDTSPYYDMEYLFLQIRSKSVGELIELVGTCGCGAKTQFDVDIRDTTVEPKPTGNLKISIPDTNYILEMRHPSLTEYANAISKEADSGTETVANCILAVYTDDEVFKWSFEEKKEFIDSMTPKQQKDIIRFLDDMPTVNLDSTYQCRSCGTRNEKTLSGFENFFV
jgi:hypothetical protein